MHLRISRSGVLLALFLLALTQTAVCHFRLRRENSTPPVFHLNQLPMTLGKWQGKESSALDLAQRDLLRLSNYLRRDYHHPDGRFVRLYIGYWEKQSGEYQAAKHSPLLCLPANGWEIDRPVSQAVVCSNCLEESPRQVNRLKAQIGGQANLFYYWFFSGSTSYTHESYALLSILLESLLTGRSDGGLVELTAVIPQSGADAEAETERTLQSFLQVLLPALEQATG